MSIDIHNILNQLYYDPKFGLKSINKLYYTVNDYLHSNNIDIPFKYKDVVEFVKSQEVYQINKQNKKAKAFNTIKADHIKQSYQMDVLIFNRHKYYSYSNILVVIDVYSRFVSCRALKNMRFDDSEDSLQSAILDIFDEMGTPEAINCDNQFKTDWFKAYCDEHFIQIFFSEPNRPYKNAIVERFNRTLSNRLVKYIDSTNKNWPSILDDIVYSYNHDYHNTIKNTPDNIWNLNEENYQEINTPKIKTFQIGDKVRYLRPKSSLHKESTQTYTNTIYTIYSKEGDKYRLQNNNIVLERRFKSIELQLISSVSKHIPNRNDDSDEDRSVDDIHQNELRYKPQKNEKLIQERENKRIATFSSTYNNKMNAPVNSKRRKFPNRRLLPS